MEDSYKLLGQWSWYGGIGKDSDTAIMCKVSDVWQNDVE